MRFAKITHMIFTKSYVENTILENPTYATLENICTNRDSRKSYIRHPYSLMYFSMIVSFTYAAFISPSLLKWG